MAVPEICARSSADAVKATQPGRVRKLVSYLNRRDQELRLVNYRLNESEDISCDDPSRLPFENFLQLAGTMRISVFGQHTRRRGMANFSRALRRKIAQMFEHLIAVFGNQ